QRRVELPVLDGVDAAAEALDGTVAVADLLRRINVPAVERRRRRRGTVGIEVEGSVGGDAWIVLVILRAERDVDGIAPTIADAGDLPEVGVGTRRAAVDPAPRRKPKLFAVGG